MTAVDLIKKHEGLRLYPYKDTTGHLTIGYGRNLEARGISIEEASILLANDVAKVINELGQYKWFRCASVARQAVLTDMAFNLGAKGLLEFDRMIAALNNEDYDEAADAMLASKWARQVGHRAEEDAAIMRGNDINEDDEDE